MLSATRITLLLALGFGSALIGCGGGSGPTPPCTNCTPTSSDFVYEANADQVSIFQVDSTSGVVQSTPSPASSAQIPGGIIATSNNFLYVTEAAGSGGVVFGYSVSTSTGALTALTGSPFNTGVAQPAGGMAVDPAGKFLYITEPNTNQVAAFTIGSNGALTAITGSPFTTNDIRPTAAVVDSSGKFLYVSNTASSLGTISAFSINSSTGALAPVVGSPFTTLVNGAPGFLSVDPKGSHLYAPMSGVSSIVGFDFDSSGILTPIVGSPFTAGSAPSSVVVDPSGKFLFSANFNSNDVSAFTINSSDGSLTPIAGSPFAASNNPFQVAINSSSSLLFVNCATSTSILTFTIDSSGALTPVAPLNGGATAGGLAVVHKSP